MKSLKSLGLTDNAVTDISPLSALSELESLDISGNPIEDISALADLTHLKSLWMDGMNEGVDLSPLFGLESLEAYVGPALPWSTDRNTVVVGLWPDSAGEASRAAFEAAFEAVGIGRTGSVVAAAGQSAALMDSCIAGTLQPGSDIGGLCLFAGDDEDYSGPLARAVTRGVPVHIMSASVDDPEGIYREICGLYSVDGAFASAGTVAWPTEADASIAVIYTESAASDGLVEVLERASTAVGCTGKLGHLTASADQSLSYLEYCVGGSAGDIRGVLLFPCAGVDYSAAISLANQRGVAIHIVTSQRPADLFDEFCVLYGRTEMDNPYR